MASPTALDVHSPDVWDGNGSAGKARYWAFY